jgi:hypothetical protein
MFVMNYKIAMSLFRNFIFGGLFIAVVSYVGTYLNPVLGAILWSYPFSLLPTLFFMHWAGKRREYIARFVLVSTFAIILEAISTFGLARFLHHDHHGANFLTNSILKSIVVWSFAGLVYYKLVYYFNLQKKFI